MPIQDSDQGNAATKEPLSVAFASPLPRARDAPVSPAKAPVVQSDTVVTTVVMVATPTPAARLAVPVTARAHVADLG